MLVIANTCGVYSLPIPYFAVADTFVRALEQGWTPQIIEYGNFMVHELNFHKEGQIKIKGPKETIRKLECQLCAMSFFLHRM